MQHVTKLFIILSCPFVKKKIGQNHVSLVEGPDEMLDNTEHDIIGHAFPHSEVQSQNYWAQQL